MKMQNVIPLLFLALTLASFDSAWACEKHGTLTAASTLPGTSLYQLNSSWTNQNDKSVLLTSLAGRPRIVAMVYTKCQTACPLLVHEIQAVIAKLSPEQSKDLHVDIFSFDSETESAQTLEAFKATYKLNDAWSVYFGPRAAVSELAAALGVQYKKLPSGDYIHSNVFFFLNKSGEVVAKQEGIGQEASNFVKKIQSTP